MLTSSYTLPRIPPPSSPPRRSSLLFFFNDTATTEIYTLSLHDALPICGGREGDRDGRRRGGQGTRGIAHLAGIAAVIGQGRLRAGEDGVGLARQRLSPQHPDRKSTRLNSSHVEISYAVFCLKKKRKTKQ